MFIAGLIGLLFIASSVGFVQSFGAQSTTLPKYESSSGQSGPPAVESSGGSSSPEPLAWVGKEFVISYDDPGFQDAMKPAIAATPLGNNYSNSINAVWEETDETAGLKTIHYSMSKPNEKGLKWSNDEPSEGDRTINAIFGGKNATSPSIAIDINGTIHVVWCQEYPGIPPSYEAHYFRSFNNGQNWSAEQRISYRSGSGMDTPMPIYPKISISNNYLGNKILHVVWSEFNPTNGQMDVYYSRSPDGGNTWPGASQPDLVISSPSSTAEAMNPDIAIGGTNGNIVHVVWTQFNPAGGVSEVFYTRSTSAGSGTFDVERTISNTAPGPSNLMAGLAKVAALGNNVYTVWDQPVASSEPSEICISMSTGGGGGAWSGENTDNFISHPDGHGADFGSVSLIAAPDGSAHAIWTELNENSPYGTKEIHYSMSNTPQLPNTWTGFLNDNVMSWPDAEDGIPADAMNPAMSFAFFGGKLKPQITWSELNAQSTGKAQRNNEIHYLPQTTFNIPVHLGWNLISVPLIQNDTNISVVLNDNWGDGNTTWNMVQGYDRSGSAPCWTSYSTYKPSSLNSLLNVNHTIGIWVDITALGDGNLTVYGDYGTSASIPLSAGWNLVGYPAQTSKSVTDSFSGMSEFVACEGYSASDAYRLTQLGGSYMMKPGEGYWVRVSADTTWTINW